jgi:hypothetical protein
VYAGSALGTGDCVDILQTAMDRFMADDDVVDDVE